jgi:hypothetical protein
MTHLPVGESPDKGRLQEDHLVAPRQLTAAIYREIFGILLFDYCF